MSDVALETYARQLVRASRRLTGAVMEYRMATHAKQGKARVEATWQKVLDAQLALADVLAWWAGGE